MKITKIFYIMLIILNITVISFAHSGRTDSYGGHNSSSGYHYHHGYEAHPHIDGYCPFESDLSDWLPSKCPSCQATINSENGFCCFECGFDISEQYGLTMLALVDGPASKTRSEYFQEVRNLEDKIEILESENEDLKFQYETLQEEYDQLEETTTNNSSITGILWFFIMILSFAWLYEKGKQNG